MSVSVAEPRANRKRRRPSGEPPPLPSHLYASGRAWLTAWIFVFVFLASVAFVEPLGERFDAIEGDFLSWLSGFRTGPVTEAMKLIDAVASDWTIGILLWSTILLLLAFKHFRHLFVLLGSVLFVTFLCESIANLFVRARPFGVDIIGHWAGSALPSRPMAALSVTLIGAAYATVPSGRPRTIAKLIAALVLGAFAWARMYLGTDHPIDLIMGGVIGVAVPLVAFRWLTPKEIFPVVYGRGKAAHLDVEGERGIAIRQALEQQLGLRLAEIKPFGLAGSGGSTPLRLTLDDPEAEPLFAKLYASTHLRADRWYKLGRTLLYGRLEDETAFTTVRRLIQYEDYMLRVMADSGMRSPRSYGFVEISPEREYLIVTDFLDGAKEIVDIEVNDAIIRSGLESIRNLWDAGLAHRDIKPSNLLVKDDQVHLIDVAFGQVRPSPWRQAVDLANMMLVLALKSSPEKVYDLALEFFTPEDIGEAFAATRGVTIPSQSRGMLRSEQRNILAKFRELAPECRRISIQRWSWRRVILSIAVLFIGMALISLTIDNLRGMGLLGLPRASETYAEIGRPPTCEGIEGQSSVLQVQAVPTAELLPCVNPMPDGWSLVGFRVIDGQSNLYLSYDRTPQSPVTVHLSAACDPGDATRVPTDELLTERYERIASLDNRYRGTRYYIFEGGCVTYDFDFHGEGRTALAEQAALILGFRTKDELRVELAKVGVTEF
jgi:tRNA A-37 threonylcarbamoyl transferase component Bud32